LLAARDVDDNGSNRGTLALERFAVFRPSHSGKDAISLSRKAQGELLPKT